MPNENNRYPLLSTKRQDKRSHPVDKIYKADFDLNIPEVESDPSAQWIPHQTSILFPEGLNDI
jgi:hypothetical protein